MNLDASFFPVWVNIWEKWLPWGQLPHNNIKKTQMISSLGSKIWLRKCYKFWSISRDTLTSEIVPFMNNCLLTNVTRESVYLKIKVKIIIELERVLQGKECRPTSRVKFWESPFLARSKTKLGFDSG